MKIKAADSKQLAINVVPRIDNKILFFIDFFTKAAVMCTTQLCYLARRWEKIPNPFASQSDPVKKSTSLRSDFFTISQISLV